MRGVDVLFGLIQFNINVCSTSENDSIERLDMPQDEIISSTSDYMDTRNFESPSPRLRRMLHSTPIAHTSVKKLFNGLDSDDDY